jgi:hypothetical protein
MVDFEYSETDGAHPESDARQRPEGMPRLGTLVNWAGAVVSLGLVVGMGVWAYQLTMRDLSGVPVIRALEGPMRVPPADPGGTQAEHQGLAVNRIAEGVDSAPVPDRLILAPPPVDLDMVALASASVRAPVAPTDLAAAEDAPLPSPEAVSAGTQALIERLMSQAEPLGEPPVRAATAAAAPAATPALIPASVPGPARSLRPPTRPETIRVRAAAAPSAPAASSAVTELDPVTLPEGTRLVQLGAFDTPDLARSEWDRLATRFPDYFAGRARVIEEASSGGSAFFRLRAHGFDDLAASRRFCAVLMAQSAPCIPVTVR